MTTPANMRWKLVDRDTGAENAQIDWTFRVGDQVKLRLVNEMDSDHPMPHPFHVHGAGRFLILARDGVVEPNLVWKDTVLVRTGETVDILLDVTNPGRWMAHCHIAEHHESGMMFSFNVAPSPVVSAERGALRAAEHDATTAQYRGLRAPVLWGVVVGVAQAATPLALWWLDTATVYALGLAVIAADLHRFRSRRRALQRSRRRNRRRQRCSSSSPPQRSPAHRGCLSSALPATGSKDLWQHRTSVRCQHAVVASVLSRGRLGGRGNHRRRDRRRRSVPQLTGLQHACALASSLAVRACSRRVSLCQTVTVTRRNVAGIDVLRGSRSRSCSRRGPRAPLADRPRGRRLRRLERVHGRPVVVPEPADELGRRAGEVEDVRVTLERDLLCGDPGAGEALDDVAPRRPRSSG